MKIAIIAASGKVGSLILKEAISRGHQVTAIVRDASKLQDKTVPVIEKDIFDIKQRILAHLMSLSMHLGPLLVKNKHMWMLDML